VNQRVGNREKRGVKWGYCVAIKIYWEPELGQKLGEILGEGVWRGGVRHGGEGMKGGKSTGHYKNRSAGRS